MSLKEQLTADMKEAMKNKEKERLAVIRMVRGAIRQQEIDGQKELGEDDVIAVISKEVKMRRELPIENGVVTIRFVNSDTDSLDPGKYEWDVRVVLEPVYDPEHNNELSDGEEVITPEEPMALTLVGTVGQI